MTLDIIEASLRAVIQDEIDNLFKIRLGQFLNYSVEETVSLRRADVQLYNMENVTPPQPQTLYDVPIVMFGTKLSQVDFNLTAGDELLILFSDRTTDNWRTPQGQNPVIPNREDTHAVDFAIAVPIVTIHQTLTQPAPNVHQIKLQAAQKLQLGIQAGPLAATPFTIELIQELYTALNGLAGLTFSDGDTLATAFATWQTSILAPVLTKLQTLGVVV